MGNVSHSVCTFISIDFPMNIFLDHKLFFKNGLLMLFNLVSWQFELKSSFGFCFCFEIRFATYPNRMKLNYFFILDQIPILEDDIELHSSTTRVLNDFFTC